jgi:hypothetical protein
MGLEMSLLSSSCHGRPLMHWLMRCYMAIKTAALVHLKGPTVAVQHTCQSLRTLLGAQKHWMCMEQSQIRPSLANGPGSHM